MFHDVPILLRARQDMAFRAPASRNVRLCGCALTRSPGNAILWASARKPRARQLADFLPETLDPLVAKLGMSQATLVLDWAEIVGERIAGVCEPARLRWPPRGPKTDPTRAADPATLQLQGRGRFGLEIQHLAPTIMERVNAHLGWRCVGKIALRQEPLERRGKPVRRKPGIDPAALGRGGAAARGIGTTACGRR